MKTIFIILLLISADYTYSISTWNQKAKLPASGRHRGTGIAIGDKGYIGLGHMNGTGTNIVYADWWEFDPATNSWTQKADYPTPSYAATAFSIYNKGYVGGGTAFSGEFFEYNPATNLWTQISDCPGAPGDETSFSIDGKGYITDNSNFYEYDPNTDVWSSKANCPITDWSITSFVIDGKGYVKASSSLYEYKPSIDAWTPRANYPGLTSNGAPGFSVNNKGYVLTGYSSFLNPVNSEFWEYDPAANAWNQLPDFPGTSRRFSVAFSINNKGYFGIGTNGTNMNDFWEFNPAFEGLDISDDQEISVKPYPNPSTEFVQFDLSSIQTNTDLTISIFNSSGQMLTSTQPLTKQFIFYKNNLPAATYYYQLRSSTKVISKGTFIFK